MSPRDRHPNKQVEAALRHAEKRGWIVKAAGRSGHAWGRLYCPHNDPDCRCGEFCVLSIASTPRDADNHARMIIRRVEGASESRRAATVPDYEFTLRYSLARPESDMDAVAEALYANGCDDALVGIGQIGRVALDFSRYATTARNAVLGAIRDVHYAIPDAALVEVSPDLVGISEVAALFGRSRQNMWKLLMSGRSAAPVPVYEGSSALWHLGQLLQWLADEKGYHVSAELLDLADVTMQVNRANSALSADIETVRELERLLA